MRAVYPRARVCVCVCTMITYRISIQSYEFIKNRESRENPKAVSVCAGVQSQVEIIILLRTTSHYL